MINNSNECTKLTVYSVAVSHRFLHERHEQTKQDLKGLEETVVS